MLLTHSTAAPVLQCGCCCCRGKKKQKNKSLSLTHTHTNTHTPLLGCPCYPQMCCLQRLELTRTDGDAASSERVEEGGGELTVGGGMGAGWESAMWIPEGDLGEIRWHTDKDGWSVKWRRSICACRASVRLNRRSCTRRAFMVLSFESRSNRVLWMKELAVSSKIFSQKSLRWWQVNI